ncbi:hypothetical protein Poli38472_009963 [Pythium oligandrum]|uniref:N-acetyltransferase domain-containing protein n=1 Tax=Pythium oligandrum TaxID=41045 RepID=A0A8K1C835_PYTOL|nr:hypothetical protein Poli38472_009963 [Pythium oligandrum]|eukprot:TMW58404.1 hypothetical protein Poli38472_009963 [Pythium oligandrum]
MTADINRETRALPPRPMIQVRSYQPKDLDQVIKIFVTGVRQYAEVEAREFWLEYIEKSLKTDLADMEGTYFASGGHFWVATATVDEQESVVGIVGLEAKGNGEGELRRMSVMTEYRRFGVGRLLVIELEKWAQQNRFRKIWFTTGRVAGPAHRFYESFGYKLTRTWAYSDEVEVLDYEKYFD